jgi:cobalt-precorrin-5B (C1)-methyltransferase
VPVAVSYGKASAKKYAGDYPSDVTAGLVFIATAKPVPRGLQFLPGKGIGIFSRDTPRYRKGEPAISKAPLDCILTAIQEGVDQIGLAGVLVTLHIPRGAEVAKKTLNACVGIKGGISILGTTGLVEPWDDHLRESVCERVYSAKNPVITTGRIGLRFARLLFPEREVILAGGKIGAALDAARGDVVLCGLPALILRHINPDILEGTGYATVEEFAASPSFLPVMHATLAAFHRERPHVRVVLVNRDGVICGESP